MKNVIFLIYLCSSEPCAAPVSQCPNLSKPLFSKKHRQYRSYSTGRKVEDKKGKA